VAAAGPKGTFTRAGVYRTALLTWRSLGPSVWVVSRRGKP